MKLKRIFTYFIDLFFVSLISSIIVMIPIFKYDHVKVEEQTNELYSSILETGSADVDEDILVTGLYNLERSSTSLTAITTFITFIYFGVAAFINNGRTLGKMIMKIKVVPIKGNKLNPGLFILRTLLITSIIPNLISVISIFYLSPNTWYNLTGIISQIQEFFFLIILGFMIFRDDERGLHDLICQTKVIDTKSK